MFDLYDCTLNHYDNVDATKRCNTDFICYKEKVLFSIWKAGIRFDKGVSVEQYGNVWYHGPIIALHL